MFLKKKKEFDTLEIDSIYDFEKITSLFSNSDTISFLDLIINYKSLLNNGYSQEFLDQSFHSMLSLPFFLFLMTALAAILTMHTSKKSENFKLIILGLIISVLIYYLKDLSVALGKQIGKISHFVRLGSCSSLSFFIRRTSEYFK